MPSILNDTGIVQYTTTNGSTTLSFTPTIGNLLVVFTFETAATSSGTISDNQGTHNTWAKAGGAADTADNVLSIWTAPVTHSSAGFAVTWTGLGVVATPGAINVLEISGQNGIDGTPSVTANNTAGTAVSVNVGTAANAGDLALLAFAVNTGVSVTWGGTLSLLHGDNTLSSPGWIGSGTIAGTGATTLTATLNQTTKIAQGGILISPTNAFTLSAGAGAWNITGQSATLAASATHTLTADFGSYSFSGQTASLTTNSGAFVILISPATYNYVGALANSDIQLDTTNGAYSIAGQTLTTSSGTNGFVVIAGFGGYSYTSPAGANLIGPSVGGTTHTLDLLGVGS